MLLKATRHCQAFNILIRFNSCIRGIGSYIPKSYFICHEYTNGFLQKSK